MHNRRAERVSRPARDRRRRVLVVAIRSPRPIRAVQRQVVGHRLDGQPGAVGGDAARGEMVQPEPYLRSRMAFSISAWRRQPPVRQLPVPVRDEAVIAVFGEEGQLGTGRRLHPPDDGRTGAASASAWKGVQVVSASSAAPSIQQGIGVQASSGITSP